MNFFKTVFSDDPDPPQPESESNNVPHDKDQQHDSDLNSTPQQSPQTDNSGAGAWNFGGLIQTLTSKSESIIEIYRRDLQEFSTGLKKEIEVAQDSLGTVTHVIDEFGNTVVKGTAQIISQGKDAILAIDLDSESDNTNNTPKHSLSNISDKSFNSKQYSRFDAQVLSIQGDASTYTEEPVDLDGYNKWKSEFSLDGKSDEIEGFLRENDAMESIYERIVPNNVDHETFWYRYYYKVYRLKKAEDVRARLVRRMSREEEDLSWDIEEDDDQEDIDNEESETKPELVANKEIGGESKGKTVDIINSQIGSSGTRILNAEEVYNAAEEGSEAEKKDNLGQSEELGDKTDRSAEVSGVEKSEVVHEVGDEKTEAIEETDNASKSEVDNAVNKNDSAAKSDEKEIAEKKTDDAISTNKNNESSKVESQHSAHDDEEEDLGWDEIEDLSSIDEKKATESGSRSDVDLRKRLSAAEAEEDLSWDIDYDDEPTKP
ncbi:putative BSD domain-containing protein [Lupinus albus]|uniref:Putative BSD domain-containing protein n=1 Tax=Lupinus albus TaxID=3870 RepID=A0A6A4QE32_LUPAL|nr:putative BSD domain-containing protein [Lupinus albus]